MPSGMKYSEEGVYDHVQPMRGEVRPLCWCVADLGLEAGRSSCPFSCPLSLSLSLS